MDIIKEFSFISRKGVGTVLFVCVWLVEIMGKTWFGFMVVLEFLERAVGERETLPGGWSLALPNYFKES